MPISFLGDQSIKDCTFVINSPPKIVGLAFDLHEYLVEMSTPVVRALVQSLLPLFELLANKRTKSVSPKANGFITDINSPLMKQVLDLA